MKTSPELILKRDELLGLAALAEAQTVIGMDIKPDEIARAQKQKKEVNSRLSALGLVNRNAIRADKRAIVQTLFHPETALVVMRDRPDVGKQFLIFLSRQKQFLLHSYPKENQHRIVEINPDEIESLLTDWFPVKAGQISDAVILDEGQLRQFIARNHEDESPNSLEGVDPGIEQKLSVSLQNRKWTASFLLLELENDRAINADSFTAWNGDGMTWVAESYGSPNKIRLFCGGSHFIGLRRMMVRRLAQFEQIIRTYNLSSNELAFALILLNRGDLGNSILKEDSSKFTEEQWQTTAQALQVRGLTTISPRGIPTLADDIEQALAPMVLPTRIGRIRTISTRGSYAATLYLLKNRLFCAHFSQEDKHILECGGWERLPTYLLDLFHDFGIEEIARSTPASISLKTLTELLEKPESSSTEEKLHQAGFQKNLVAVLAEDIAHPVYRASVIGIDASRKSSGERLDNHPMLFLLKGSRRDWLFRFPHDGADAIGLAIQANRKRFLTELLAILNPAP